MHIALCDDNIADRKQFERIAKRESDRRAQIDGTLFVSSFGNAKTLLTNPMQYDAFYIDICHTEGITGTDVAMNLLQMGINAPIVMCCSEIDYREKSFPDNVFFLEKPIRVADFTESVNHAVEIAASREKLIELRVEEKTLYVREAEILYAIQKDNGLNITMNDGKTLIIIDTAKNFFSQLIPFPSFVRPGKKNVVNCRYIENLGFLKATMTDGKVFYISPAVFSYTRRMYEELH